ncbi:ahpC/TSA family protein [Orientia chuto str. Dubai]|uniref:AhpC/TSA family protein n=1 Tax=Orientia chuto str. Dubai TaxID=1359168 RepID=A0A0F3MNV9_9RICK|nr:peroxiredoxin [Candidatus Orientia mediorientalis]KJV56274.1 ahpC/TSA family protein [Orientia chuto str. Dubai]
MEIFVGKPAYDFTAAAVLANNSIHEKFNLKQELSGRKVVLFFYPLDFTFVCPTEIIAFNNRYGEFLKRNTEVIGISIDSPFSHKSWKLMPYNRGGIGDIQFPLVSDINKNISKAYNVLNEDGIAVRATFIIDQDFILRHVTINDLSIGRKVEDSLRIIDAIDFHKKHGDVCPAGWNLGDEGMESTLDGVSHFLTSNAEKL